MWHYIWSIYLLWQTDQGIKCVPADKAEQLAGSDPDYNNRLLFNAIAGGDPVSILLWVSVTQWPNFCSVSYHCAHLYSPLDSKWDKFHENMYMF